MMKTTLFTFIFSVFAMNLSIGVCQAMYVIVEAKDGTSQEECLGDVHQDTASDVFFEDCLI